MFGRSTRRRPYVPPAAAFEQRHVEVMVARAGQRQERFYDWIERKLIPVINQRLAASRDGRRIRSWSDYTHGYTYVNRATSGGRVGAVIKTRDRRINTAIELYYRDAGYEVNTTVESTPTREYYSRGKRIGGEGGYQDVKYVTWIIFGRHQ